MYLPASSFDCRHELIGADTANSRGTAITPNATANTKAASWTTIVSATGFAYEGVTLHLGRCGSIASYLVDIGIDNGSGTVFVLIPDVHVPSGKSAEGLFHVFFPVHIPAGARIVARCQSSATSGGAMYVAITGHGANLGGYPGYSRVLALNSFSLSRGVAVDPGGTANRKGSWTQIASSTAAAFAAICIILGYNGDNTRAAFARLLLDIGIGTSGAESRVIKDYLVGWATSFDGPLFQQEIFPVWIPAATRVAARASCLINTAGDRTVDLSIYGLVP